ncbi:MAG: Flp family type IVb pilin [Abditibacteriaceae bacterium]
MIQHFFYEEEGQSLVEYGLLIALVALVVIAAVSLFGSTIKSSLYDKAINQLPN